MRRFALLPGVLAAVTIISACASQGRSGTVERPGTGGRLGNDSINRTVVLVNDTTTVARVQELLVENKVDEAIALAEEYVASLQSRQYVGVNRSRQRYDALNVLCVALTRGGRRDEALARCTEATELLPMHWSAFNNRGTVWYVKGEFGAALEDYRRARDRAHERDDLLSVQHNIELTEDRIRERFNNPVP